MALPSVEQSMKSLTSTKPNFSIFVSVCLQAQLFLFLEYLNPLVLAVEYWEL